MYVMYYPDAGKGVPFVGNGVISGGGRFLMSMKTDYFSVHASIYAVHGMAWERIAFCNPIPRWLLPPVYGGGDGIVDEPFACCDVE